MRVAICIPSMDRVHADFMSAYVGMVGYTLTSFGPLHLDFMNFQNSVIHDARNRLVVSALEREADWILWLDSDLDFPRDTLLHLLGHDLDIVAATYPRRTAPFETNGIVIGTPGTEGLQEALAMPGGLMLVRASVYGKIPVPWYEDHYKPGTLERIGEDIDFCLKARDAGFKIWCDLTLSTKVAHLGQHSVTLEL